MDLVNYHMELQRYNSEEGNSGVTYFEIGKEDIIVVFNGTAYRYTYSRTGKSHVEQMKRLARKGKGLSTYISQKVKKKYEDTFPIKTQP